MIEDIGSQITIGLPVYNAMPYLPETIESLLTQTMDQFEILAIVDGGSDDSLAYLQSISDSRLRVLEQPNQGVTTTLNRMLRECQTPWLVRQDADDISYPHRLEKVVAAIQTHPEAGMFYSLADYHPRDTAVGSFRCSRGSPEELRGIVRSGRLLAICHSSAVLNVAKTLEIGAYRIGLHNEDADLWWRMALKYDIHCIPDELVGFRQSSSNVSSQNLEEQQLAALYVQYQLLSHLWGLSPRPLNEVGPQLEKFLSSRWLRSKEQLRSFNMSMARRSYASAATALCSAMTLSPEYILRRFVDELFPSNQISNGIRPELYLERKEVLWS